MSIETTKSFRVYRFQNEVAFHTNGSPTIYLDIQTADALIKSLHVVAEDIEAGIAFQSSQVKTINYPE
jgi:hypothetical protein